MRTAPTPASATYPARPAAAPAFAPAAFAPADALRRAWRLLLRGLSDRAGLSDRRDLSDRRGVSDRRDLPIALTGPSWTTAAIDDLYHHRRLQLVRLALLLVDDLPTAEDVVQDAFTALFRRYGERLTALDDPEAYVRTSVVNGARSVLRRRRTVRAYIPEREGHAPPAEEYVLLHEEHREVLVALRRLTRRQREVLVLRYWSNLTEAQIANTLGVSVGTVKSTASRALNTLGKELEILR